MFKGEIEFQGNDSNNLHNHRMIFTACALVAKRYDALMAKGMDYSEFHSAILNRLNKELMRDKRQESKALFIV